MPLVLTSIAYQMAVPLQLNFHHISAAPIVTGTIAQSTIACNGGNATVTRLPWRGTEALNSLRWHRNAGVFTAAGTNLAYSVMQ
jgi:hypothetical protein